MTDSPRDWQNLADGQAHHHRVAADAIEASRRYGDGSLPPYRYLPGRDPHSLEGAQGHGLRRLDLSSGPSFAEHDQTWRYCIDLFNHGYWWEAREGFRRLMPLVDAPESLLRLLAAASDSLLKRRMGWRSAVAQGRAAVLRQARAAGEDGYLIDQFSDWLEAFDRCLRPGGNDFPRLRLS